MGRIFSYDADAEKGGLMDGHGDIAVVFPDDGHPVSACAKCLLRERFTRVGDLPVGNDDLSGHCSRKAFTAPSLRLNREWCLLRQYRRLSLTASRRAARLQVMSGRGPVAEVVDS